ncbi:MAG: LacI family DNA-binding transcriptional regulator [Rudaea sp.]|uniref:LacI family DNA-binding transcriptional regulator n=1 Tax=Rudaea sp. TaxID=2136325 RepID=UPI0039E220DC
MKTDTTTPKRSVTIKDVARRAKVSLKTVSRVVNHEPSVLDATRKRVERAIAELDYRPDQSARSLRSAKSYTIGMVYDNPNAYYVIAMQNGVLSVCRETGFDLNIHPCDSNSSALAEELRLLVQRSRLAGLVLAPPMSERMELIRFLAAHKIKFVRILSAAEDPRDGYPCVFVDDRDAAYAVTEHLIQLGHQRIGFLWGGKAHRSSPERFKGYEDALEHYGIAIDRTLIVEGDYSFDDGFRGARKLLALKNPPTAIFGSNDEIAAGVLAAAKAANLNVPYDLSIAGFEDSPFSRQCWPALTTAAQATSDIARRATERLIAEFKHGWHAEKSNANVGFSPTLVVRGSTGPVRVAKG